MIMSQIVLEVNVDSQLKEQSEGLFKKLGISMNFAINLFLEKCIECERLPLPYNQKTEEALEEARRIAKDDSYPTYDNIDDLFKALNSDD